MFSHPASEGLQHDPYSTLEVKVPQEKERIYYPSALSIPYEGIEAVHPEIVFIEKAIKSQGGSLQTICGFRRKIVWTAAIIALTVVVIVAVVGGVLGGQKAHQKEFFNFINIKQYFLNIKL